MAKKTDPDDVTLYDLDPKFQDRLLKWLTKGNVVVDIKPVDDGFEFTVSPGEKFQSPDFETGLCEAMGARYKHRLVNPEFSERVHTCLSAHDASITFMSAPVDAGDVGFKVAVSNREARGEETDQDFEIALVLAEDKFLTTLPSSRLAPEDRSALERALVPPAQREDEDEERQLGLRRALMEPRPELLENRQSASYRVWCRDVDEQLAAVGAGRQDSEYWRRLYLAGFSPSEAMYEFGEGVSDRAQWRRPQDGAPPPRRRMPTDPVELAYLENARRESYEDQARKYKYFILLDGEVVSGWEYKEDAQEALAELSPAESEGRSLAKLAPKSKVPLGALDEFAARNQFSRNAPPRRPQPPPRRGVSMGSRAAQERTLPRLRRMADEYEYDDRPFDPEAPREHYASAHHFAVNTRR